MPKIRLGDNPHSRSNIAFERGRVGLRHPAAELASLGLGALSFTARNGIVNGLAIAAAKW